MKGMRCRGRGVCRDSSDAAAGAHLGYCVPVGRSVARADGHLACAAHGSHAGCQDQARTCIVFVYSMSEGLVRASHVLADTRVMTTKAQPRCEKSKHRS